MPRTSHWFEAVADHLGEAYLRYSFTKGTVDEVDALVGLARLVPGDCVLDVGCGPGRHSLELAARGFGVTGVDISETFIELARAEAARRSLGGVRFELADARELGYDAEFDLVLSLCQGAFGLTAGPGSETADRSIELDEPVLDGMRRAVRPGGWVVVSAFSAYFQLRHAEEGDTFEAMHGVNHEHTAVCSPEGVELETEVWTTCYTPRELRLLARHVGLEVEAVHGVTPGRYRSAPPTTDCPEFLLVARRPLT